MVVIQLFCYNLSMPNIKKTRPYVLYSLHIPVIVAFIAVLVLGIYFTSNLTRKSNTSESILGSDSKKTNVNKTDKVEKVNNKEVDYEPKLNSKKYGENVTQAVSKLKKTADVEEQVGNIETSEEIAKVAEAEEDTVDETTEAIESVESRAKWQDLLFPDYKNLGQLRSSLAHNTNSIRKLSKADGSVQESSSSEQVQEQMGVLLQERERIIGVIEENESRFSLLGWIVKLFMNYDDTPVDSVEDEDDETIDSGTGPSENLESGTDPSDLITGSTEPGTTTGE